MKKYHRELLKAIRDAGVKVLATSTTNHGHLRIEFLDCNDSPRSYFTGSTPSCPRATANAVSAIVRMANQQEAAHDPR